MSRLMTLHCKISIGLAMGGAWLLAVLLYDWLLPGRIAYMLGPYTVRAIFWLWCLASLCWCILGCLVLVQERKRKER